MIHQCQCCSVEWEDDGEPIVWCHRCLEEYR